MYGARTSSRDLSERRVRFRVGEQVSGGDHPGGAARRFSHQRSWPKNPGSASHRAERRMRHRLPARTSGRASRSHNRGTASPGSRRSSATRDSLRGPPRGGPLGRRAGRPRCARSSPCGRSHRPAQGPVLATPSPPLCIARGGCPVPRIPVVHHRHPAELQDRPSCRRPAWDVLERQNLG